MGDDTQSRQQHDDRPPTEQTPEEIVDRYKNLVCKVAHRLKEHLPEEIAHDDLVNWGYAGLLEAHQRYDETKGNRFATYAYYRIRGAILDACPEPIVDPRRKRAQLSCNEVLDTYAHVVEAQAQQASIEDRLSMLSDISGSLLVVYVLSDCPERALRDEGAPHHEDVARRRLAETLRPILEALSDNEQKVIDGLYFRGESQTAVGKRLGYSPSWVCRIHMRALDKLRELLEERDDVDEFRHAIPV